ncbi:MAG: hypothetical protein ACRESC_01520, partial [Gammaproteobacteria bacterium]
RRYHGVVTMTKLSNSWLLLYSLIILSIISFCRSAKAENWPLVEPLYKTRTYVNPGRQNMDTKMILYIKNINGNPVYKFECHNGNYDDDTEMDFSGDFQCALFGLRDNSVITGNLLAANTPNEQNSTWWNRGRMRAIQLQGKCLAYPEYSTNRHFKLRGMLITFEFKGIEWDEDKDGENHRSFKKFTVTIDVAIDKSAHSSRAELAIGPKPPESCYP